ncbi:DUF6527 family protein [Microbispora rosea]|uniref:DUF6527 family protein n=1 Tax=Microbispora rosea TaxID=58117 RepID=UPI003415D39B
MRTAIRHEFVAMIPDHLDEGVVYVSMPYATAVHLCCCGCGHEVVTPLHPLQWSLILNGETISLTPSIGNWSFPCRSHYWIRAGQVHRARPFSDSEISGVRAKERALLSDHYEPQVRAAPQEAALSAESGWTRLTRWFRRSFR